MSLETTGNWLPLQDFSTKYQVSESALRRSIEAKEINYRFEDGKYFIMDEPVGTHQRVHRPSQESDLALVGAHQGMMKENSTMTSSFMDFETEIRTNENAEKAKKDEAILTAANKLLIDLKKAYSQILNEKDREILQLKQEMADLKMLVSIFESENERSKKNNI